jgi:hypothetical protein
MTQTSPRLTQLNAPAPPQIRTRRPGYWFWIADIVTKHYGARIGLAGIGLYTVLASHVNQKTGTLSWSLRRLSMEGGCTRKTAGVHLRRLVQVGLILVEEHPGYTYTITLLDLPAQPEEQTPASAPLPPCETDLSKNDAGGESNLPGGCVKMTHEPASLNQQDLTTPQPPNAVCDMQTAEPPPTEAPPERPDACLDRLGLDAPTRSALDNAARIVLKTAGYNPLYVTTGLVHSMMAHLWDHRQAVYPERVETSADPLAAEEGLASATCAV